MANEVEQVVIIVCFSYFFFYKGTESKRNRSYLTRVSEYGLFCSAGYFVMITFFHPSSLQKNEFDSTFHRLVVVLSDQVCCMYR